jgi:hypothetical protein
MDRVERRLDELQAGGRVRWKSGWHGWLAEPDEVVHALAGEGYEESKREVARTGHGREPAGGVWQGINRRTGSVASAIWVQPAGTPVPLVFIEIDGRRLEGDGA